MGSHNTIIFASFNTDNFKDSESGYLDLKSNDMSYTNMSPSNLTFTISSTTTTNDDYIDFTTNGIDGFGSNLSAFQIPKINFAQQNIYFVAKFRSLSGAPRKSFEKPVENIELLITQSVSSEDFIVTWNENDNILIKESSIFLDLILGDGTVVPPESAIFTVNYGDLLDNDGGGYLKAYLYSYQTGTNNRIRFIYQNDDLNISLSGYSTPFDILPAAGTSDVRKINENNNQAQNFKDLRFQDVLQNKPALFDDFLGQIVGTGKQSPDTLGIKNFEKTANFVSNVADPDTCNLKSLGSLLKELNITFEEYNQQFPPSLQRLVDILSVGISRQKGGTNQYQLNFNDKGFTNKTVFGKNKGDLLPVDTTILHTGPESRNIIALEKFSEEYSLINTNILSASDVEYNGVNTYPLSTYNSTWGWGLVLPAGVEGIDITDYYQFYDFDSTTEGSLLQKFVDFDNIENTYITSLTSDEDYSRKWGEMENIISHNLYTNLNLISGS